jgi:tetratricopeptide (TPR) repeat protein
VKTEKDLSSTQRNSYLKALSALELGNLDLVVTLMGQMIAEEPEFLAGRKLLREAEVLRARSGKSSFLGVSGSSPSIEKSKARRAIETGDFLEAIREAEKTLETDPMGVQPNKNLHEAAEMVAKNEREKIRANPATAKLLDAARDKMRSYEAIARFALETIALDDRDKTKQVRAFHDVGRYLMSIEEFDEATKVYEKILQDTSTDREARDRAKEASRQRGYPPLIDPFPLPRKDRTMHEESSEVPRGDQTIREETVEELAGKVYEAHEAGKPDQESARKLADLYYKREDYDKSLEYYRYLSGLAKGTDPGLLRKIGDTEVRWLNQSITEMEKQLSSLAGEDPAATAIRAEIEKMRRGKADQMLGEARKRADRNPADLQYRFELGEQLVLAGHYKDATPELQKARSNPNTRPRALYLLGKCYTEFNRLDLAAKTLTDAAAEIPSMDGTKKDIIYSLGQIYERMGDKEKSLECMKQIYDDPNSDIDDGPAGAPGPGEAVTNEFANGRLICEKTAS